LDKIGLCAAELLRIFYFQNGGRPPSWIWYDVMADHQRLVFDGLSILLKLHVHRFNILRDIAIFIFDPFGLKLPIHAHFGGVSGDMTGFPLEFGTGGRGQKTSVLGLPEGRKSFKIGLAVSIQYIPACDIQPASQPLCRSKDRAYVYVARVKTTKTHLRYRQCLSQFFTVSAECLCLQLQCHRSSQVHLKNAVKTFLWQEMFLTGCLCLQLQCHRSNQIQFKASC